MIGLNGHKNGHARKPRLPDGLEVRALSAPDRIGKQTFEAYLHGESIYRDHINPNDVGDRHRLCAGIDARGGFDATQLADGPDYSDLGSAILIAASEFDTRDSGATPVSAGELIRDHPKLREPIIYGWFRRGETGNLISSPKVGKSWLAYLIALIVVTGRELFGRFQCRQGRVLLIDNELHPETLAHRLKVVADALGLSEEDYASGLDVLALRGRLTDLHGIDRTLHAIEPGQYDLVILDALYRAQPEGVSENENAGTTGIYNTIDRIAARLDCAWLNVHHSSKGAQGDKGVTDVGAGAGAQSRAVDAHVILRQHEEDGAFVLEAALRSFAPINPLPLRWTFPLWTADESIDASKLKGLKSKNEARQDSRDREGFDKVLDALLSGPQTNRSLRGRTGLSRERLDRLLDRLEADGKVGWNAITVKGKEVREYFRKGGDHDAGD